MAEELEWNIEAFDEAFQEVSSQGMAKADFKERLVWLPNALKHNKPESPNVVRSWRDEIELLPECDLKNEAIANIRNHLMALGTAYLQAFDEILTDENKPSAKAYRKASPKTTPNQEQEQEQEQEEDQNLLRGAEKISPPPPEENLESCGLNLHDGTRPAHAGPERRPLSAGVPEMPRPDDPEFIRLPLNDGSEFSVTESLVSEFESLYPAVDVRQALRNQRGWLLSDLRRRKTARGIKKFITGWLAKDQNRGGNRGRDSPSRIQDLPPPDNVIPPGFRG
ncbi:hypothetical protein CSU32_15215 [Salmonella enterica subsp. diarizonae]|nr:hypothetical protein [Salmonella enterica subsp. diarizonae]ECI3360056.1 hypothetical protein [Salmonella enterica subsp. diarizonae]